MPTVKFDSLASPQLAAMIKQGAVGVMPTDTVYGLVAAAADQSAVTRLYGLKDRHQKPGTLVAGSIDQLTTLGIPKRYLTAVADYWPNALSVVIPLGGQFDYLTMGIGSLAVRIPADAAFRNFLEKVGPLMTTSANPPAEPPARNRSEAEAYFNTKVDYYVDGGFKAGPPSTVIRVVDDAIEVLRQGAVRIDETGRLG